MQPMLIIVLLQPPTETRVAERFVDALERGQDPREQFLEREGGEGTPAGG